MFRRKEGYDELIGYELLKVQFSSVNEELTKEIAPRSVLLNIELVMEPIVWESKEMAESDHEHVGFN